MKNNKESYQTLLSLATKMGKMMFWRYFSENDKFEISGQACLSSDKFYEVFASEKQVALKAGCNEVILKPYKFSDFKKYNKKIFALRETYTIRANLFYFMMLFTCESILGILGLSGDRANPSSRYSIAFLKSVFAASFSAAYFWGSELASGVAFCKMVAPLL